METLITRLATTDLIADALALTKDQRTYEIARRLSSLFPDRAVVECSDSSFDLDEFVRDGHCTRTSHEGIFQHTVWHYYDHKTNLYQEAQDVWYRILWRGQSIDVVTVTWFEGHCRSQHNWLIADTDSDAVAFYKAVGDWTSEVRGEVLVFDGGEWRKSEKLFEDIKNTTFDNLILPPHLVREMQADFAQFLESRDVYERYSIPWKRGVLLTGPPGNGKTHTVKALVNWLAIPCLYVKSLTAQYCTAQDNIRAVFDRARSTTPCMLVFEDLDSLIDDKNRSFFLNELDGFATNTGIIVLATTNHPEKLDPALVDRPSRFDRKYHFELPTDTERLAYVRMWNDRLDNELQVSSEALQEVAAATAGFSFAYLKELFLSSMMRWITSFSRGAMLEMLLEQCQVLRTQMHAMNDGFEPAPLPDDEEEYE